MIENQIRLIGCFDLIYRIHVGMDDDDLVIVKLAFSDVIYSIDCIGIVNIWRVIIIQSIPMQSIDCMISENSSKGDQSKLKITWINELSIYLSLY